MEELDLKELISIFLKRKILIIVVVILFAIIGAVYTLKFITPIYQSSTSLVLVQIGGDSTSAETNSITATDITLNSKLVNNYREIAKSKVVANKVIKNLNLNEDVSTIQKSISVTSTSDTELIRITIENTDSELACKIATEVANVFMEQVKEIYNVSNVHILDKAEVQTTPSNIHLFKNVVVFAFVGGILVSAYILLVNMLDTTIKSDTDIERALKLPVLASIVLTDDGTKKKNQVRNRKKSNSKTFKENINSNIQVSYEHNSIIKNVISSENENDNDNVSMFSYINRTEEDITNNNEQKEYTFENNKKKKNHRRKGDRK